ncbi:MAG: VOC family protein [Actinobacteria bacterium]|nr:VOC family protein [Actinomycetota bacterium]
MRVERTDFATVITQDKERSLRFYGETLDLRRNDKAHPDWPEFETGNLTLSIVHYEQIGRSEFAPNTAPIALRVGDAHEARTELEQAGVEFLTETYDSEVCHLAVFSDPDGNRLMLHRRYAPYAADGSTP